MPPTDSPVRSVAIVREAIRQLQSGCDYAYVDARRCGVARLYLVATDQDSTDNAVVFQCEDPRFVPVILDVARALGYEGSNSFDAWWRVSGEIAGRSPHDLPGHQDAIDVLQEAAAVLAENA